MAEHDVWLMQARAPLAGGCGHFDVGIVLKAMHTRSLRCLLAPSASNLELLMMDQGAHKAIMA